MAQLVLCFFTALVLAQDVRVVPTPFDLTGRWALMSYTLGEGVRRVDGPFGEGFTAVQTQDDLIVASPSLRTGRGGEPLPPIRVTYRFDGSNTNTDMFVSFGSSSRSWDTTSWVGETLLILKHWQGNLPEHISFQVAVRRDPDGTIVAERIDNPSGGYPGNPSLTWRARYRQIGK